MNTHTLDTPADLEAAATAIDGCTNLFGAPLDRGARARLFAALDSDSWECWVAARSLYITPDATAWQLWNELAEALCEAPLPERSRPAPDALLYVLRLAAGLA